jgi:hypothetical protein
LAAFTFNLPLQCCQATLKLLSQLDVRRQRGRPPPCSEGTISMLRESLVTKPMSFIANEDHLRSRAASNQPLTAKMTDETEAAQCCL